MAWPNSPSALVRQRGATAVPFLAAFDSHLALAATFVATASIFFALHLLATNAPPVLPVTVRVMSSTNASTVDATVPASPLGARQSACDSAFMKSEENTPSAFNRQAESTPPPFLTAFPKHLALSAARWPAASYLAAVHLLPTARAMSAERATSARTIVPAAAGTPDPGVNPGGSECNTNSAGPSTTGSRANCKSNWGAFDMVGNVSERVADWGDLANGCTN